ncbi:hypothetical protein IW261DRAFT_1556626 [Armillaria novae-zelandiae]|uniref:Uncharacterized protein n=1 Tax=Armillaria novae-zelandiae TaxID=153914 RepID=A0AA39PVR7_9AGAR|nr:hypothetical protein IW261DRAFT_1556626 [Armillaria novae-zelandiae]
MESMASIHATALEICYTIYGELTLSSEVIDRFYESSAKSCSNIPNTLTFLSISRYENPVLTATSRSIIFDIFKLGRRLHSVDIPQPLAVFYTLLRLKPPEDGSNPLLKALRVWNEVGDISEHESFDGHRKAVIEHTLNILVLPSIHIDSYKHAPFHRSALSTDSVSRLSYNYHPASPSLPIPGTSLSLPSPFHFKLHVITRLSFNEQGHITNHRDYWDVKDLMGLLPGVSLAQWILSRLAAKGLSYNSRFLTRISARPHLHDSEHPTSHDAAAAENRDLVNGPMAYVKSAKQTYGH